MKLQSSQTTLHFVLHKSYVYPHGKSSVEMKYIIPITHKFHSFDHKAGLKLNEIVLS